MRLREIIAALPGLEGRTGDDGVEVGGLTHDSRMVQPGDLFCCIPGARVDGHSFIGAALERGARALLVEGAANLGRVPDEVPAAAVCHVRAAMPSAACAVFGHPTRSMRLVGITGTNGKTSTCYLVDSILRAAGETTGLLSTLEVRIPGRPPHEASRTTPEAGDLQRWLRAMVDGGARWASMEVSSHALVIGRVDGTVFDTVAFTNLTHDHLDFHRTPEAYFEAKRLLFEPRFARGDGHGAVLNIDDPRGRELARSHPGAVLGVGTSEDADVRLTGWQVRTTGTGIDLITPAGPMHINARLRGLYTVRNVALAVGIGLAAGIDPGTVRAGVEALPCVPGRLEPVGMVEGAPLVLVDYAHTPDGLRNVLSSVREMTDGRVIVVFGCGGDRDRTKRPEMGGAAAELADVRIVTSDNPRSEEPGAIIDEIIAGLGEAPHERIVDRRAAIFRAIACGQPGDIVVLAGKGHETYQEFATGKVDFDDRRVAAEALGLR